MVDNSAVSPFQSAKNLSVTLDNTLLFSANIKALTRSCRFMLYNIHRVRPYLTQEAAQVLIQALVISCLDYCNSLLVGPSACAIKPLQLIQNAAARLVLNLPKVSHGNERVGHIQHTQLFWKEKKEGMLVHSFFYVKGVECWFLDCD